MGRLAGVCTLVLSLVVLTPAQGQADEICREYGETPTRESGGQGRAVPFVFGRVKISGLSSTAKRPRVSIVYADTLQPANRQVLGRSGNFCFRRLGSAGLLILEVEGVEQARRQISDLAATRHQEDFEIIAPQAGQTSPPGVISTRFVRPPNENTVELYRRTAEAEEAKRPKEAIELVKQIVAIDSADFIAWAKLGSLHLLENALREAGLAFEKALSLRPDYTAALLNLGIVNALQSDYPAAIKRFQQAVQHDNRLARGYRLLGEAYLQNKQGTLGLAALDRALELDPIGMADGHLLKARLYDLVGAKHLAAAEYKSFLSKIPDHPDRKKLEKYMKENASATSNR